MSPKASKNISSAGMDRKITPPQWTPKRIAIIAAVIAIAGLFLYAFIFMDLRSTLNVDKEKLAISTVQEKSFQEYIPVTGTVQPIQTIYLDALEGGVVEQVFKESGTRVKKGEKILTLSNSDLRLRVLSQTSGIYDQINQTRNSRLNIEQNTLNLKNELASAENQLTLTKADYLRKKKLHDKKLVADQDFTEAQNNYEYQKKHYHLIYESFKQDSIKAQQQLTQIDESLDRMFRSLSAVRNLLDKLQVNAPISGQLSTIELNPGQSISQGERIGQIDILDRFKVRVGIDEYHLARITKGLNGSFDFNGSTYALKITKVYPVVDKGQFQVDMEFTGDAPQGLTRGQTLRIRLALSDEATQAVLLARGGFYQSTGGNWVFKLSPDGQKAVRQHISLGRQNPDYFEVLSGLKPGDKVITSSYDTFGDNEVLTF